MKKDILQYKVEQMIVAIVPRDGEISDPKADFWDVWLVNLRADAITNVLVVGKGYGKLEREATKTSTLRHFFEKIDGETAVKIEPIQARLFELTNEYWISFTHNGYMYDKKYVFVKGSIAEEHLTRIPVLEREGVMIR